jgi:hypothetical protein
LYLYYVHKKTEVSSVSNSTNAQQVPSIRGREFVYSFSGKKITSDAGLALVERADRKLGLTERMAAALGDPRDPRKVKHTLVSLLKERIFGIAAGYEDANDMDTMRSDPALKAACGRLPDSDPDLASQPTISRMENSGTIFGLFRAAIAMAKCQVAQLSPQTLQVIIDVDATDDQCHGEQQMCLFNKHYDGYCFLPLVAYITGDDGIQRHFASELRPGTAHGTKGLRAMLHAGVRIIRSRFPNAKIILRADSGFGCAKTIAWCRKLNIDYVLGVPGNQRLHKMSWRTQADALIKYSSTKRSDTPDTTPEYAEFRYKAKDWKQEERIIIKTEVTLKKELTLEGYVIQSKVNPRYVVTSLEKEEEEKTPEKIYWLYCERGDRENRIKEFKVDLKADRTSCTDFLANQFRLLLHTAAAMLVGIMQEAAEGSRMAKAQVGTLRLAIIKIGARIIESTRRILFEMARAAPNQDVWWHIYHKLA